MPAPLAKGVLRRCAVVLAKSLGIIIAASVLVAAGIAIYESPQVRQWVDQSRRKIAVALHSLGDDIQPSDHEQRKREELVRRNRNEFIRRAREEGVAVDLDELARIGTEDVRAATRRGQTFDDLVGSDGRLRETGLVKRREVYEARLDEEPHCAGSALIDFESLTESTGTLTPEGSTLR